MQPTQRTTKQTKTYGPKVYRKNGDLYRIRAVVRYDDDCQNGYNSFAITGFQERRAKNNHWYGDCGGCLHDLIREHFPELAPFIKWHGMTPQGPSYYLDNTLWHAGDRDCWGLGKGEARQIVNGKTKELGWELVAIDETGNTLPTHQLPRYADGPAAPTSTFRLEWRPWLRIGEGKKRELDHARATAIWPEATDEELTAPDLRERLIARLPGLIEAFYKDLQTLGLTF